MKFPVQQIVLEEYVGAVKQTEERVRGLDKEMERVNSVHEAQRPRQVLPQGNLTCRAHTHVLDWWVPWSALRREGIIYNSADFP